MGEVGELLELLHGPPGPRFRTVRGVLRHRSDTRLMGQARLRLPQAPHGRAELVAHRVFPPEEPPADRTETVIRLWLELPLRLREEIESSSPERDATITVVDGGVWTVYSARADVAMSETAETEGLGMHGDQLWRSLLDPAEWIPALDFELRGEVEHAGRAALERHRDGHRASGPGSRRSGPGSVRALGHEAAPQLEHDRRGCARRPRGLDAARRVSVRPPPLR